MSFLTNIDGVLPTTSLLFSRVLTSSAVAYRLIVCYIAILAAHNNNDRQLSNE